MKLWHLTFPARKRFTLFPDEDRLRLAVRELARIAGDETLLFCLVDDHAHVVVSCGLARAKVIKRALRRAWKSVAAVPLADPDLRPVADRGHLFTLVRYHLRQLIHHGVQGTDPALWSGSCFQEMIGARVIDGLRLPLWTALPRFRMRLAYEYVDLPQQRLDPLDDEQTRAAGASRIAAAAGAALALPVDYRGKSPVVVAAKRSAVQTAHQAGIPTSEIAWALGVSESTARRLRQQPVDPRIARALRIRLALENARAIHPLASDAFRAGPQPTRATSVDPFPPPLA